MNGELSALYRQKLTTADEAVRHIRSGWRVFLGSGCAEPQELVAALCRNAAGVHDVEALDRYPKELKEFRVFGQVRLLVRPLKATDERTLQEFFYTHDPETIFNRYFAPKLQLAHREAAKLCCVDYRSRMALAVFQQQDNAERIVAVARYANNPRSNMAETAVVVHEEYRRLGIARYLLGQLERHAMGQGIEGFCSEILPGNEPMLDYHRSLGHSLVYSQESDTYQVEFRFNREYNNK